MIIKDAHGQLCKAELQNAHLVPGYPCDILSVTADMLTGGEITFSSTGASMTTQDGNNFDIVKHMQLYYLPVVIGIGVTECYVTILCNQNRLCCI